MNKNDSYFLGYISRVHGIKGAVVFTINVDDPLRYKKMKEVYLEQNNQLIKYEVENVSISKDLAIVKLKGIETPEAAKIVLRSQLYMPLTFLPKLTGKRFYFHDVIGFKVIDSIAGEIGIIETILEFPGQNLFQVKNDRKEVLIPVRPDIIDKVEHDNKIIHVTTPEGLLDVYLGNNESPTDQESTVS